MGWPTGKPDTTVFDSADDAISTARAELQTMSTSVGEMVDFIDTTGITSGQTLVYDSVNDKLVPGSGGGGSVGSGNGESLAIYVGDSAGELSTTLTGTAYARINNSIQGIETDGIKASSGQAFIAYSGDGVGGARIQINLSATSPDVATHGDFLAINPLSGSISKISTPGSQTLKLSTNRETNSGYIQINPGATGDIYITSQDAVEITGNTNITGALSGTDGANGFKISSEGLTSGSTTIYNDRSEESYIRVGEGDIIIAPSQDSANKGTVDLQIPTSSSASAGANTLPSNPVGFLGIKINGTDYKVPYYNT